MGHLHAVISVITANILLFISGLSMAWPSSEIIKLLSQSVTLQETTYIVSILPAGSAFGPFLFGVSANLIGRKLTLLLLAFPFLFGYLAISFGEHLVFYLVGRFLCGVGVGGTFAITPLYIGEIADKSNRGILSSTMNISTCLGILVTYSVGPFLSFYNFNLMLSIFPCIFLALFSLLGTESPYYYIGKHQENLAKVTLEKLRGSSGVAIDQEMQEIQGKIEEMIGGRFRHLSQSNVLLKASLMTMGLFLFQQFTGVNIVMFYSQLILGRLEGSLGPEYSSIILGAVFFLSSFTCPLLIERIGRKSCVAISSIGITLSLGILGITCTLREYQESLPDISLILSLTDYIPLTAMVTFMIFFNMGLGPVPHIILGEIFPPNIKSIASSVLTSLNWLISFFVSVYIGYLISITRMSIMFYVFTFLAAAAFMFNHFFVIETRGKSLQEIQNILSNR